MAGTHRKNKKTLTLWVDEKVLARLRAEAKKRGLPRSNLIENAFRKHLGLPLVHPPKVGRPSKDEEEFPEA